MKVWILTEEHNDYNQYGEYFIAAFRNKPTIEQIVKYVNPYSWCTPSHILNGGGRTEHYEDVWWNLREEELQ